MVLVCMRKKGANLLINTILTFLILVIIDSVDNLQNPKSQPQPSYPVTTGRVEFREKQHAKHIRPHPVNPDERPYFNEDKYFIFSDDTEVILWIDVPNSFPWRKCLHLEDGIMVTDFCELTSDEQLRVETVMGGNGDDGTRFRLVLDSGDGPRCIEPDSAKASDDKKVVRVRPRCSDAGFWRWSSDALLEWSGGGCLSSLNGYDKTVVVPCDKNYDDQIVEFGVVSTADEKKQLGPINLMHWTYRMARTRHKEMKLAKLEVDKILTEISHLERSGAFEKEVGSRRAVVFYVDKGSDFLAYLKWWIFTWKMIGLNTEEEAFDIVLLIHPEAVHNLPDECKKIEESFNPELPGPGQCLFKELIPISERDHKYDKYLNSQECLFNNASRFLRSYKILLRADLDTFPTPKMVGYWPKDVICNRNYFTTFDRDNIESVIINSAAAAGIKHNSWHNTGSTWMGPSLRIVTLSKLTTYLARFIRAYMFGPGTTCRCPTCTELPSECKWGHGIYAGTLLLYAQEIAMNRMWTQREYEEQDHAILDISCEYQDIDICKPVLLHAMHNKKPFSKFAFIDGNYSSYDLGSLDITNVRDFSIFMAVSSAGQGINRDVAWKNFLKKENGTQLSDLC